MHSDKCIIARPGPDTPILYATLVWKFKKLTWSDAKAPGAIFAAMVLPLLYWGTFGTTESPSLCTMVRPERLSVGECQRPLHQEIWEFSAETLCSVELKARALDAVGRILSQINTITPTQREILPIFNELFADIISSLYLAACALDKPAQIVLRRVLELGVAIVYLWDLPHKFYGWKQHDHDLNFSEMVDHVNAPQYLSFVKSANSSFRGSSVIEVSEAKRIYGSLSDTVHGKISTFESVLPDRFKFTKEDWQTHLSLVDTVESLLLQLFQNRFLDVNSNIRKQFPQIART